MPTYILLLAATVASLQACATTESTLRVPMRADSGTEEFTRGRGTTGLAWLSLKDDTPELWVEWDTNALGSAIYATPKQARDAIGHEYAAYRLPGGRLLRIRGWRDVFKSRFDMDASWKVVAVSSIGSSDVSHSVALTMLGTGNQASIARVTADGLEVLIDYSEREREAHKRMDPYVLCYSPNELIICEAVYATRGKTHFYSNDCVYLAPDGEVSRLPLGGQDRPLASDGDKILVERVVNEEDRLSRVVLLSRGGREMWSSDVVSRECIPTNQGKVATRYFAMLKNRSVELRHFRDGEVIAELPLQGDFVAVVCSGDTAVVTESLDRGKYVHTVFENGHVVRTLRTSASRSPGVLEATGNRWLAWTNEAYSISTGARLRYDGYPLLFWRAEGILLTSAQNGRIDVHRLGNFPEPLNRSAQPLAAASSK